MKLLFINNFLFCLFYFLPHQTVFKGYFGLVPRGLEVFVSGDWTEGKASSLQLSYVLGLTELVWFFSSHLLPFGSGF